MKVDDLLLDEEAQISYKATNCQHSCALFYFRAISSHGPCSNVDAAPLLDILRLHLALIAGASQGLFYFERNRLIPMQARGCSCIIGDESMSVETTSLLDFEQLSHPGLLNWASGCSMWGCRGSPILHEALKRLSRPPH